MNNGLFSALLVFVAATSQAFEHKKIKSFSEVPVSKLTGKVLVVTDINDTIVNCKEPLWQKSTMKAFNSENSAELGKFSAGQKNLLANLVMQKCSNIQMAQGAKFFAAMKGKKFSTVALTAAYAEPLDGVDMEDFVTKVLKQAGYRFNSTITQRKVFDTLKKDAITGAHPVFLPEGILLTNGAENSKGDLLKAYIDLLPAADRPGTILYFDDSVAHLDSVATAMGQLGIVVQTYQMEDSSPGLKTLSPREEKVWESLLITAKSTCVTK